MSKVIWQIAHAAHGASSNPIGRGCLARPWGVPAAFPSHSILHLVLWPGHAGGCPSSTSPGQTMTLRECYAVLEIEAGGSLEEVKKAWKLLAAVWHPDRFAGNSKLRLQAEQKLKRINEAYQTLKRHFEQGKATGDFWSEPAAEYVDSQCRYLGGDVRLRSVSKIEFGGRPACVRIGEDGIMIATVGGSGIEESVHCPAGSICWFDERGTTWSAPGVRLDPYRHETLEVLGPDRINVYVRDPERIVEVFVVALRFRNEYFRELFRKRVCERFCPINATEAARCERQRLASERRERELQRKREDQAKRKAEQQRQREERLKRRTEWVRWAKDVNTMALQGAAVIVGTLLLIGVLFVIGITLTPESSKPDATIAEGTDLYRSQTTTVRAMRTAPGGDRESRVGPPPFEVATSEPKAEPPRLWSVRVIGQVLVDGETVGSDEAVCIRVFDVSAGVEVDWTRASLSDGMFLLTLPAGDYKLAFQLSQREFNPAGGSFVYRGDGFRGKYLKLSRPKCAFAVTDDDIAAGRSLGLGTIDLARN